MSDKRRVYYRPDGTVIVVSPVAARKVQEKESDWLDRVFTKGEVHSQKVLDTARFNLLFEQQKPVPDLVKMANLTANVKKREDNLLSGLDREEKLVTDFPANMTDSNREKLRGSLGAPLFIDNTVVTKGEKRVVMEADLDAELANATPNLRRIVKMQRRLQLGDYTPVPI